MFMLRKAWAFFWKDFITEASYKFAFIAQLFGIFFSTMTLFFMSRLLGTASLPALRPYGGDYFSFVLIGIAFASYLHVSLRSFQSCIREAQLLGTLEALLVTQTGIPAIILFSSIYSFAWTSLRVVLYLLLGVLVLGVKLAGANYLGALLILFITIIAFSSFGVISASFTMVMKKGNPVNWIFNNLSWLLGGVFYPVAILPGWLQKISYILPITYSLEGMRLALLKGCRTSELLPSIFPLLIFTVIVLPTSLLAFAYAVKRAKAEGSLTQY